MPETTAASSLGEEIARTAAKKAGRDMQERSLRGTVSAERGMAMKRVVRNCLCGLRRRGRGGSVGGSGLKGVEVGVEKREGSCEGVEGVGRGEERADGERIDVEN